MIIILLIEIMSKILYNNNKLMLWLNLLKSKEHFYHKNYKKKINKYYRYRISVSNKNQKYNQCNKSIIKLIINSIK